MTKLLESSRRIGCARPGSAGWIATAFLPDARQILAHLSSLICLTFDASRILEHRVYIIQECSADKTGAIKVGVAKNTKKRLDAMQIGNSRELKIVMEFGPMTEAAAYELEGFLHRRFRPQHIRGEWFECWVLKWITDQKAPNGRLKTLRRS